MSRRIALQKTDAQLAAIADFTIDNGSDLESAQAEAKRVYDAVMAQ